MSRIACLLAVLLTLGSAGTVAAQGVEVTQLAAPDAFTTPGRATGLAPTLWAGASAETARTVLPLLAAKPLSPAAAALARRILATGAPGPEGAGRDPAMAATRANALMFQGDPRAAAAVLAHAPGLDRSSDLARAAAETALLTGDEARACKIGDALTVGRDETYWLKLRTYCQAIAGQTAQAQLTFELVQAQVKDPVFTRLMGAKLAGAGNPGAASLRNGLDYALSHSLGLDLAAAKASPAVAAAMAGDPQPVAFDLSAYPSDKRLQVAALALSVGDRLNGEGLGQALSGAGDIAHSTDPKSAARGRAAFLLLAMTKLPSPISADFWAGAAEFDVPNGKSPLVREFALNDAAARKAVGETALLALWTCAEAGSVGPAMGDRIRIVRALHLVGLDADARAFALEGLASLK
jgi:hypothetical protein